MSHHGTKVVHEKKIDVAQVKELIENALKSQALQGVDQRIEFYNVSKVEGDVSIVSVRGKKKPGYHLKINIKYRGVGDYKGAKGLFKYTSFSDDGDRDFEVESSGDVHPDICKRSAQDSADLVEDPRMKIKQTNTNQVIIKKTNILSWHKQTNRQLITSDNTEN